jgi:WD40 repeat protein
MFETATGREVLRLPHGGFVTCVAFSPDGKYIASGGSTDHDLSARIWEVATGREIARTTHWEGVQSVAFSPDGKWVASGGWDAAVRVWEASSGREVARLLHGGELSWGTSYEVYAVAFSPDGKLIASGSYDKTARMWLWRPKDLITEACSRVRRNLTTREWQQYLGDEPCRPTCPNLPDLCTPSTPMP